MPILKWDFYKQVEISDHVLTIQTADQALWANVLLTDRLPDSLIPIMQTRRLGKTDLQLPILSFGAPLARRGVPQRDARRSAAAASASRSTAG